MRRDVIEMTAPLIADRLAERRMALGLNKLNAARKIGLTQSGYVRYENGERKPTIQTIESMAIHLNTSVDYLTGRTDDPSPDIIVVSKADSPILFEIIEGFQHHDEQVASSLRQAHPVDDIGIFLP